MPINDDGILETGITQTAADSAEQAEGGYFLPVSVVTTAKIRPRVPVWEPPGRAAQQRDQKAAIVIRDNDQETGGTYTQRFLLQNYFRSTTEQMQVVLHSEGWNVIFHKSKPTIWSFSGILYDEDGELNWTDQFLHLYDNNMKGTVAAGRFSVTMIFGGRLVTGFIYKLDLSGRVPLDTVSTFNMQMLSTADVVASSLPSLDIIPSRESSAGLPPVSPFPSGLPAPDTAPPITLTL